MNKFISYIITTIIIIWFIYLAYDLYAKFQENIWLGFGQLIFMVILLVIIIWRNKK